MSLLTIVQNAAKELGLSSPSSAYASTDAQVVQLVALAQREGQELRKEFDWQALRAEQTFTSVALADQTTASWLPSDFDRMVQETFYNRSRKRPVFGPISPQDWQFTQAVVASTLVESFTIRGSKLLLTPTPPAGDTYAFEYISNKWCESAAGTAQAAWAADTDLSKIAEAVVTLGVIWRFLKAKDFDYSEAFRTYQHAKARQMTMDVGRPRRMNFAQRTSNYPRAPYTQEGSWNI
jgi:hypothetical protein